MSYISIMNMSLYDEKAKENSNTGDIQNKKNEFIRLLFSKKLYIESMVDE